jgi:hypothetical protein
MSFEIEIIRSDVLSLRHGHFVEEWSRTYFDPAAVSGDLQKATVHWRFFLNSSGELVSHVALTEYLILLDGRPEYVGAIGGLFTKRGEMGNGHATRLLDEVENFIFERLAFRFGILFCLPALVPFYARRGWMQLCIPVTLEQRHGLATWPEAAMILSRGNGVSPDALVHVPIQPRARVPLDSRE